MHPLDELRVLIVQFGWAVRNVADPDPAKCSSYTVGLTSHGHPEIVMTGLPPDVGQAFLNLVGDLVVNARARFIAGETTAELVEGEPLPILEVTDTSGLTAVEAIYREIRAVQIVWSDSRGHLPWEPAYGNPPGSQPLLGLWTG